MFSRRNNPLIAIICIGFAFILGISNAFTGDFGLLFFVLGIIFIPLTLISIFNNLPTKKQQIETTLDKKFDVAEKSKEQRNQYSIIDKELKGKILAKHIPSELHKITDLNKLTLECIHPIEISELINNNPYMRNISLKGPFYFKNMIYNKFQILTISVSKNSEVKNILSAISNQINIESLGFYGCSGILCNDDFKIQYPRLSSLTINVCDLIEFPYHFFRCPKLEYITLSNNRISHLNRTEIKKAIILEVPLKSLSITSNLIRRIPVELLNFPKIESIYIGNNPISKRRLKSLKKKYPDVIKFGYRQEEVMRRFMHPDSWILLYVLLSILLIIMPYWFFDSIIGSTLLSILVITAWLTFTQK